jgi:SecD/SecF fusion protein
MLLKRIQKVLKLAAPDIFANRSLQGEGGVDFQMTDAEVQKVIRRKVDESVESAFGVLRKELINLALLNLTFKN